jgi:hypothetical protein
LRYTEPTYAHRLQVPVWVEAMPTWKEPQEVECPMYGAPSDARYCVHALREERVELNEKTSQEKITVSTRVMRGR